MQTVEAQPALKPHVEGESRRLDAPIRRLDLTQEIEALRRDEAWKTNGHAARTLAKYDDLRVVLITLKPGARMEEHQARGRVSLQCLSGHVQLHLGDQQVDLPAGNLVGLEHWVTHDVQALEESVLLLTLAWPPPDAARPGH